MKKTLLTLLLQFVVTWMGMAQTIGGNVNPHTKVISAGSGCDSIIEVEDASSFAIGDRILLIQMKGARARAGTHPSIFGMVSKIGKTGLYEFNDITSIDYASNTVTLSRSIVFNYDLSGAVQMVKVAKGNYITTSAPITCDPWDGKSGGVIVIEVENTLTLNHSVIADGAGFRGGDQPNIPYPPGVPTACAPTMTNFQILDRDYYETANKGEGICSDDAWPNGDISVMAGQGAWGNAGGGGVTHNSGGGGGSNFGRGGKGGNTIDFCNHPYGGKGGWFLRFPDRLIFGGGGGAGHQNNLHGGAGASGGGIIIIIADDIQFGAGVEISAEGADAASAHNDAAGGGGGGGTIAICANTSGGSIATVDITGGSGGNHTYGAFKMGPGGGGGGGVLFRNAALSNHLSVLLHGGNNGVTLPSNDPWGAKKGQNGLVRNKCIPVHSGYELCRLPDIEINPCEGEMIEICVQLCGDAESVRVNQQGYQGEYFPDSTGKVCLNWSFRNDMSFNLNFSYGGGMLICPGTNLQVDVDRAEVHSTHLQLNCGDEINLDDYILCDQDYLSYYWEDITHGQGLINPVIKPQVGRTVYRRTTFSDSDFDCIECISEVVVDVDPLPVNQVTLYKCEGETVQLTYPPDGIPSYGHEWYLNGQPFASGVMSISVNAHNGDQYQVNSFTQDGCVLTTVYTFVTTVPVLLDSTIHITCGDSIDLDDYDLCGGYSFGWEEISPNSISLLSSKVAPNSNTTYKRMSFSDPNFNCLSCIMTLTVIVDPIPTQNITVNACDGQNITISPAQICQSANGIYNVTPPSGVSYSSIDPNIPVIANDGDVYTISTTTPEGCTCVTRVTIQASTEYLAMPVQFVDCGTTINLEESFGVLCNGGNYIVWEDLTNNTTLLSTTVTISGPRQFRRRIYSDPQHNCLVCEVLISFDVNPATTHKLTVYGCEGEDILISAANACAGYLYYDWAPPGTLPYGSLDMAQTFTAHDGDVYTITGYTLDSCICITEVTVKTTPLLVQGSTFTINCDSTIDLNSYNAGCPGDNFDWYDENGNLVADPSNVTITEETTFIKETRNEYGCVLCRTSVKFVLAEPNPVSTELEIGCSGDSQIASPVACTGGSVIYLDENGDVLQQPVLVSRTDDGRVITIKGTYPNGCPCEEELTIKVKEIVTTEYDAGIIDIECGDSINLNQFAACSGTSGEWYSNLGDSIQNGIYFGRTDNGTVGFYREFINASTCERCVESVTIRTTNTPVIDTFDPDVYYLCGNDPYIPDPCPGAVSYLWINYAGLTVATTEGIPNNDDLVGTATRYAYDANGCLLCEQTYHLVHVEELTQTDVDNITPDIYFYSQCETGCIDITPNVPLINYSGTVTCDWQPAGLTISPNGDFTICPPWDQYDNQVFTRYCYNEDNCLIAAQKVQFLGVSCVEKRQNPVSGQQEEIQAWIIPNPNNGLFTIKVDRPVQSSEIHIVDSNGKILSPAISQTSESTFTVDMQEAAPGSYYVRIRTHQVKTIIVR